MAPEGVFWNCAIQKVTDVLSRQLILTVSGPILHPFERRGLRDQ